MKKKRRRVNLNKLNYILIPKNRVEWDELRKSRRGRVFRWIYNAYFVFSQEGRVLLFLWMLLSALSINIGFTQYYVVWSVLTGLLLGSVLLRRFVKMDGVSASFTGPPRVTRGEEVFFSVEFHNQSGQIHQAIRVERPFLPWDGKYFSPRLSIDQLEPGQTQVREIVATFQARGEHHLDPISGRALAPLGLALSEPVSSTSSVHFLVVPQIADVAHIDIETTQKYQPGGVALASITGEARELVGVRPYRPGDPIRDLHAKTWARIGEPAVREYQQEYFTRIGIVIDTDEGRDDDPMFESMLSLAGGIVAHLSRGEALLDLLVIGQDIHELTLGRSLGFLDQALDLLACVSPQDGFQGREIRSQIREHLSRLSCMIVLSMNWDESREEFAMWIEQQGIRCRRIHIVDGEVPDYAREIGATLVDIEDIQGKELVL
ncbi:MAG: DUF58 domain-containing protein [Deltaproteobacteria bacterium]|nr:MAG: DUF58 domain-containing protein [Deltaproteobacteria bacterium]